MLEVCAKYRDDITRGYLLRAIYVLSRFIFKTFKIEFKYRKKSINYLLRGKWVARYK